MAEKFEELAHDEVPGYKSVFFILFLAGLLYLIFIFFGS